MILDYLSIYLSIYLSMFNLFAGRRSAFLTPAKKARLRNNPTRVRFADAVIVNGTSVISPSCQESYVPLMPNVLKVFLENGQTKSFKYDNKTTVKDVLNSLQEKLSIRSIQHFALVLYNMRSPIPGKLAILREDETIAEIAAKPGSRHFRCLFRVTFVPVDAYALLKEDPASFEYYFTQCCNDVVQERFAGDLKYESMFRLAALQIHQHVTSRGTQTKFSLKSFEKEFGLNRFVPRTILENMKMKDVRRTLTHYLRQNQNLTLPGQKHLPTIQARLHYIKILSDLLTFGGRIFLATIAEGDNNKTEHMIVVGPRTGISRITNVKTYALEPIADFEHIEKMSVIRDGENIQWVSVELKGETTTTLCVGLLNDDVPDFLSLLEGYYRVLVDSNKVLLDKSQLQKPEGENSAPVYDGKHRVIPSHWSYPDNIVSQPVEMDTEQVVGKYVNGHETQDQAENVSRDAVVEVSSCDELCSKSDNTNKREAQKRETDDDDDDDDDDDAEEREDNEEGDEYEEEEDDISDPFTPDEFVYSKLMCVSNDHDFDTGITSFTPMKSESSTRLQQQLSPSSVNAELLTFKRYVPSPISSHAKRLRQRKLGTSTAIAGASEEELLQIMEKSSTTQILQPNPKSPPEDSTLSDTDSMDFNGLNIEEKPLLSVRDSLHITQSHHSSKLQKDSDSDSWGTPTGSPGASPGKSQLELRPHSFNFSKDTV
ncbi:FERM and PDZ domain-containing protein 4,FERM and PDZ domain-containing protein 1 [Acanthosepion pharaonis]|uniref:FERM and PDZ domain-containing protein 4,FERM and PDZ domain-containing protein 1 n=1 Tax=Acanthosepion pharaonis TaxID=158019 RepID=A0A812D8X9_ACAPH|nr:FERM and PDZ domain-containing protein 4,FERM and PDZ domain-containing protein 1 [Sepia pharaonis]